MNLSFLSAFYPFDARRQWLLSHWGVITKKVDGRNVSLVIQLLVCY